MSIGNQIETIVASMTGNNNPPQIVTIRKAYNNNTADITTTNGLLRNIPCSGRPVTGTEALLIYNQGEMQNPYLILFEDAIQTIIGLGLGLFHINTDGELIVELPYGVENPFSISGGKLYVSLDTGLTNNYSIHDTDLYYNR